VLPAPFWFILVPRTSTLTDSSGDITADMVANYINPVTNMRYAAVNGTLSIINGTTNSIVQTYKLSDPLYPKLFGNPLNNIIFVVNGTSQSDINDNRTLSIINGTTNSIISTVPLNGTSHPFLEETTNGLYSFTGSPQFNNQSLVIRNGYTGTLVDTIPISSELVLSSYTEGVANSKTGKIYTIDGFGDNVTVIDYINKSKVLTIPAGWRPNDIAINSKTNTIYVTNLNSNTTSVINGNTDRRINIPGPPS
jgi:YVTN family beta-propeller protein